MAVSERQPHWHDAVRFGGRWDWATLTCSHSLSLTRPCQLYQERGSWGVGVGVGRR